MHYFSVLCRGKGSSYKLVLLINNPVGEALLTVTPLHKTLRTNTTHQIPVSMDLFNFTFPMFSIRQQDKIPVSMDLFNFTFRMFSIRQ